MHWRSGSPKSTARQMRCRPCVSTAPASHAKALMQKPAGERGLLAGLPIPIKDLTNVAGVRTTQGSPIYKDNIPAKFRHSRRA